MIETNKWNHAHQKTPQYQGALQRHQWWTFTRLGLVNLPVIWQIVKIWHYCLQKHLLIYTNIYLKALHGLNYGYCYNGEKHTELTRIFLERYVFLSPLICKHISALVIWFLSQVKVTDWIRPELSLSITCKWHSKVENIFNIWNCMNLTM